ncbi:MAG: glycoside hydrolase family 25 protein [Ferruginibacter sp.]|nr:glycoside hydrolase family 25 protein [Ferruginibacter sp.]
MARKKYSIPKTLFKVLLAIIVIANVVYYVTYLFTRPPHIMYPAFGIDIPQNYLLHGIDVSRYQQVINWSDVKDMQDKNIKIGFAFIKATEGVDKVDAQFSRNWLQAEKENIPKGAYHYFTVGKSGKAQAANFIEIVKLKKDDLPPVLDIEETSGESITTIQQNIKDWLEKVEQQYKVKPVIYTNISFYNTYLRGSFDEYHFWIAHYFQAGKPRIDRNWTFWQHNENGHVNGIKTTVDFNVFCGDSTEFKNLLIK